MTADIPQNLWSLVCSCLNSYWAFHLFTLLIFFKLVAFCTEFHLLTPICFFSLDDNRFPLYLWSPSGLLSWWIFIVSDVVLNLYIYPFSQDWLYWWLPIFHKTYDHWSVAVLTVTEHFIYSHFWFFSNWLLSALNSICLQPFVLFFLW